MTSKKEQTSTVANGSDKSYLLSDREYDRLWNQIYGNRCSSYNCGGGSMGSISRYGGSIATHNLSYAAVAFSGSGHTIKNVPN